MTDFDLTEQLVWLSPTQLLDLSRIDYVEIHSYNASYARHVHIHTHAGGLVKIEVPGTNDRNLSAEEKRDLAQQWVVDHLNAPAMTDDLPVPGTAA